MSSKTALRRAFQGFVVAAAATASLAGCAEIEVPLADPMSREPFRHVNYLSDIALTSITGLGPRGYLDALDVIAERFGAGSSEAAHG